MVTFVPYDDNEATAKVLDRQRLGKQRVEGVMILRALVFPWKNCDGCQGTTYVNGRVCRKCGGAGIYKPNWHSHPAVRMWRGYEYALADYILAICNEWKARGYVDNCATETIKLIATYPFPYPQVTNPPWWGDQKVHASHRGRLIAKLPEHYGSAWPCDFACEDYVWPV